MKENRRHWYITVIASLYLILCSVCSVKYALSHFEIGTATVALHIQLLCYSMAISAALYFIRPRLGHVALLIVTALTLISVGETQPAATGYHFTVLVILLFPLMRKCLINKHNERTNSCRWTAYGRP